MFSCVDLSIKLLGIDTRPNSLTAPVMTSTIETATANATAFSVQVRQADLASALALVARAVAKHPLQAILSNVLLRALADDGGQLELAATDLNLSISYRIPAQVSQAGELSVPAQKLGEVVSKLPRIDLSMVAENSHRLTIKAGRSKLALQGLAADEFPRENFLASEKLEADLRLNAELLQEGLSLVGFAAEKRETNNILSGVCFEVSAENGLELAATDGSRLAYYHVPEFKSAAAQRSVLPYRAVQELLRLIDTGEQSGTELELLLNQTAGFFARTAAGSLSSTLVDGSYPRYQQLIPKEHKQRAVLSREALLPAMERVATLANERNRVVKLFFEASSDQLSISANTPELGEAFDQLDLVEYQGEDFTIAFNVNYLLEALRNLTVPQLEMQMSDPLRPLIIVPANVNDENDQKTDDQEKTSGINPRASYLYLLMPIQIRN